MILDAAQLQERYLQRISGVRDKKAYIGPETITLQINNSCNLTCQFCWTHAPGNPAHFDKAHHFPWDRFVDIVRDSVDLKVDQVHITGSGEPTMHPKFREMMRYLEDKPLYVKLLTNATFPLEYCADVIKGDHVIIDLSAVDRKHYQDMQGKDLFDRVVNNIKQLAFLRDTTKPHFHIEIAYILNSFNIKQSEQMKELAARLGVNSLYFEKMNVHDYNKDIALPETPMSVLGGEERKTPPACLHGWFYLIIKADDITSTCCRIHQMHLGDLEKWSLKELWGSSHMMNVRLLGKYGHLQKMYKACQTCPYYDKNVKRMNDAVELEQNEKAVTQ